MEIEVKKYKDCTIEIGYDEYAESPRGWHASKIVAWHPRYAIGEEYIPRDEVRGDISQLIDDGVMSVDDYSELMTYSNLYMLDHSGISISTSPFSCPWDSGQVGYVYLTRESGEENNIKNEKEAIELIQSEIECYDRYIRGDIYYYSIVDQQGEIIDSLYGIDDSIDNIMKECESIVDN